MGSTTHLPVAGWLHSADGIGTTNQLMAINNRHAILWYSGIGCLLDTEWIYCAQLHALPYKLVHAMFKAQHM